MSNTSYLTSVRSQACVQFSLSPKVLSYTLHVTSIHYIKYLKMSFSLEVEPIALHLTDLCIISHIWSPNSNVKHIRFFVRCLSLYISSFSKDESNINKTLLWVTYHNIFIRLDKTDTVFKESAEENNGGFDPRSMQLVFLRWSFYTVIPLFAFVGFHLLISH